jgi:hypothetical protein
MPLYVNMIADLYNKNGPGTPYYYKGLAWLRISKPGYFALHLGAPFLRRGDQSRNVGPQHQKSQLGAHHPHGAIWVSRCY